MQELSFITAGPTRFQIELQNEQRTKRSNQTSPSLLKVILNYQKPIHPELAPKVFLCHFLRSNLSRCLDGKDKKSSFYLCGRTAELHKKKKGLSQNVIASEAVCSFEPFKRSWGLRTISPEADSKEFHSALSWRMQRAVCDGTVFDPK